MTKTHKHTGLFLAAFASSILSITAAEPTAPEGKSTVTVESKFLRIGLSDQEPAFASVQVDSLGYGKFGPNPVTLSVDDSGIRWALRSADKGKWIYSTMVADKSVDLWTVTFANNQITLNSRYVENAPSRYFELLIDQKLNHATLLGKQLPDSSGMELPSVLHLPDQGSLRITGSGLPLDYEARRRQATSPSNFVRIRFPAATKERPAIDYILTTAAIYPALPGLVEDSRYDGYRRNFLNIFQWHPRLRTLANNSSSDVCGLCFYQYAEVAVRTPELAPGLRAIDLLRISLDRVLDGGLTYGQVGYRATEMYPEAAGWKGPYDALDHAPSLLWASARYALTTEDRAWADSRYPALSAIVTHMLAKDTDGDGLIEYEFPANSGSWPGKSKMRPANWMDTIGFGHEDAYSNALAHQSLRLMADLAIWLGKTDDSSKFNQAAKLLKSHYATELLNPATGLIAGWKSADGQLHDYAFPFINGIAVTLGLVEGKQAHDIMTSLLASMEKHGYDRFDLGLPGNLIPIRKADYIDPEPRFGGGLLEDGSDGFQTYINGGATACHAYWTIKALYQVGMIQEARKIFHPMLKSYEAGAFQGVDEKGKSRDWKNWKGEGNGYEGYLVDGYLGLIAVEDDLKHK
jgi:hypothetical protein